MKEAYYFSHDSNARHDPKMTAMRGTYGAAGYGWYWMLIEMMMESSEYKLDMHSKYTFNAFALQLQAESMQIENFVKDCIDEFDLFITDGQFFWSQSLLRRMEKRKDVSKSRSDAANKRWGNANASKNDANAMQKNAKESKGKEIESKGKEIEKERKEEEPIKPIVASDECDLSFQKFWDIYPTKGSNKKMTSQKWSTLWKNKKINLQEMLDGVGRYVSYQNHNGYSICAAQVFLNQERWKDEWVIEEQQRSAPKGFSKVKSGTSGKGSIPIARTDKTQTVSDDDFERFMKEAAELQASKEGQRV